MIHESHLSNGVASFAIYSDCKRYRYWLDRVWNRDLPMVAFIGLNPSTATALEDDPTVRRCRRYADRWGYGGFIMLNAFAFRSTDPKGLLTVDDPIGVETDRYLREGVFQAAETIACWGNHATLNGRDEKLRKLLEGQTLRCLKLTGAGQPWHPLYLRNDAQRMFYCWANHVVAHESGE